MHDNIKTYCVKENKNQTIITKKITNYNYKYNSTTKFKILKYFKKFTKREIKIKYLIENKIEQ